MPTEARPSGTAARMAEAARALALGLENGRALDEVLQDSRGLQLDAETRAAVQALSYGSLRWWPRIEVWLGQLLDKPVAQLHPLIRGLLAVGLHQLAFSNHPPYAIVNEAVFAVRLLRQPRA